METMVQSHYREALKRAGHLAQAADHHGALAAYDEAIRLAPCRADAHYEMGLLHHKLGQVAEAIVCFERAAELVPDDATVWNNLGVLHYSRNDVTQAERVFRQALSLDERYGDAWYGLAKALLAQGRKAEAAKALRDCLRWDPQHSRAQAATTVRWLSPARTPAMVSEMRPKVLLVERLSDPHVACNVNGMTKAYLKVAKLKGFDYRGLARKYGRDRMNQMLLEAAKQFRPDLIHLGKCETVKGSTIKAIKENMDTTVVLFYEDYRPTPQPWIVDIGKYADYTLFNCTDEAVRSMYRDAGVKNPSGFWTEASDPDVFYPRDVEKTYEVSFMGTNWLHLPNKGYEKRRRLIRAMLDAGLDVHIFGYGWEYLKESYQNVHLHQFVIADKLAEACSQSRVTLGINGVNNVRLYASWPRAVNTMASGAFHLTHYVPGLETVFENRKHLVWFNSVPEAVELTKYYLAHEEERERIAAAGRQEVLANHTWDKRIGEMIGRII